MRSDSNTEILPVQVDPAHSNRSKTVMSADAVSHLRKSINASSSDDSMYHHIAAFRGERVANEIARRLGWHLKTQD